MIMGSLDVCNEVIRLSLSLWSDLEPMRRNLNVFPMCQSSSLLMLILEKKEFYELYFSQFYLCLFYTLSHLLVVHSLSGGELA